MFRALSTLRNVFSHPANRAHRLSAIARSIAWQLDKRVLGRTRAIPYHGQKLLLFPDSEQSSAVVYFDGWPDFWEMKFLARYLRAGDCVLDIGANVGVYTIFMAGLVAVSGQVFAFEPDPDSRQRLELQVKLNGLTSVAIEPYAVSDQTGEIGFSRGGSSATRHIVRAVGSALPEQRSEVRSIALDDWEPWPKCDLIKIDIEGAEPLAFLGASHRLRESPPPVILMELAGYSKSYGYESEAVMDMLAQYGYDFAGYDIETNQLIPTVAPWQHNLCNVLAIHRGSKSGVASRLAGEA